MKKQLLIFLLLPLLITSCGGSKSSSSGAPQPGSSTNSPSSTSSGGQISVPSIEEGEKYDAWLNTWSQPGHLYFHYNRGDKAGYEKYCLWLWQYAPQSLEGSLWGFSNNPKVSPTLTLHPMSNHWMSEEEVGEQGSSIHVDPYGAILDIDLYASNLVGGKSGNPITYQGMTELGFLLPQQSSMDGNHNWISDGGKETYVDDFAEESNWREVNGGKAIHIFVSTGALSNYSYFAGSGVPQAQINPIDEDTTGQYRSDVDAAYSNALGNSSTSDAFKSVGVGYQIFVASFKDSNGDGIGDIRGIINSLDYLANLGVEAIWLTPIQKSDSYHGYDISDYLAIDKRFGTIEDYQELLTLAHQRGMKVLMDLVLNHTSKNNVWFSNSQWGKVDTATNMNWRDVYYWKYETDQIEKYNKDTKVYDKITVKQDAESENPSWYRDGESHYYYYGKFGSGMPEINYLSASTRKLVIDMANYWLDFGLDGFRLDAVKHIFMRDECYQTNDIIIPDVGSKRAYDDEKGQYVTKGFDYSSNLTKNIMWWKEFAHGVKANHPDCFLVGENFDGWGTRTASYYQALDSQFSFSTYYHIPAYLYNNAGGASNFSIQAAETFVPYSASGNVLVDDGKNPYEIPGGNRSDFIDGAFTSNHDVMRAINQVNGSGTKDGTTALDKVTGEGNQVNKAKIHAAITLLNPGLSWIYYGDELGMSSNTDQHVKMYGSENCEDIWYRQPFLWHDENVRADYKSGAYKFELDSYNKTLADAETQQADFGSMFNWYKSLIEVKKMYPKGAKLQFCNSSANVLVLKVTGESTTLVIYINVGTSEANYMMNPDDVAGTSTAHVKSLGGAPTGKGNDIGAKKWSIAVFKSGSSPVVNPDEDVTYTVTNLPSWIQDDGCVIFAWVWGNNDTGSWKTLTYGNNNDASFVTKGELNGFLLARCVNGTTQPDWSITSGNNPGRIYNKTNDITTTGGIYSYACADWVGYPS